MLSCSIIIYLSNIIDSYTIWSSSSKTVNITSSKYNIPSIFLSFSYHFFYLIFCIRSTWIFHSIRLNIHWYSYFLINWFLYWYNFIHIINASAYSIIKCSSAIWIICGLINTFDILNQFSTIYKLNISIENN